MAYLQDEKPAEGPYHWPSSEEARVIGKDHHRLISTSRTNWLPVPWDVRTPTARSFRSIPRKRKKYRAWFMCMSLNMPSREARSAGRASYW